MNLRTRLSTQGIRILLSTVVITAILSMAFGYIYIKINKIPVDSAGLSSHIILIDGEEILYSNNEFTKYEIKEILMNISANHDIYSYKGTKYTITIDDVNHTKSKIIKLTPLMNMKNYYTIIFLFVIIIFIITFVIASLVAQKHNMQNIINPIINLKKTVEKLSEGDLDIPVSDQGAAEVSELCVAIEKLRIKLNDSIFYQQKYDDNRKFLISSISHDLKTPVTSVRGYIEGVLDGIANTEEKRREYLEKAVSKTNLISTMIEDLLLYSKLDLNQISFDIKRANIADYLQGSVEDNSVAFEREGKEIRMENTLDKDIFVDIDLSKFQRVVQNIIDNAKKHIKDQTGRLVIKLRETKTGVIIEFRDNGVGITKEDLPHIFDRFYRADNARKVEGSSGLGLAIAKQIVEGIGGNIWAISEENQGTGIIISLKKQIGA